MDQAPLMPPDFALPGFAALVELTMAAQHINCNEAIIFLEQRWEQTGLAGVHPDQGDDEIPEGDEDNQQQQPDRDVPPPHEGDAPRGNRGQAGHLADQAQPAGLQAITFDPDACIATTLMARPANYAIKHIEARKHVPLWYFSREGLHEAARVVRQSDENDTLAITKVEAGHVTVQSASSLAASKNAKLDHQLTYSEFMYTKNLFLTAIDNAKWGDDTIDSFNWFFHNLDNHPMREEGDRGERALLLYASRARMDWHNKLALRKAYNIATINEDLLTKIARKLVCTLVRVSPMRVISFTTSSCLTTPPNHVLSTLLLLSPPPCALHAMVWFGSFRWTSLVPINSNQLTVDSNSHETCIVGNPLGPLHPILQARQEAHAQHTTGRSPGENHHGAAAATMASGAALFATLNPHRPAQSASEPTKSAPTAPPAMHCPCGIIQCPLIVNVTSKDACSIRADISFAGISNDPMDAWAAETPTMEPRSAPSVSALPACLSSRASTPYNADGWRDLLIEFNLSHKHPTLLEQLMYGFCIRAPTIT